MGVNKVCTMLLTGKHDWSISKVAICKIKSCLAHFLHELTAYFTWAKVGETLILTMLDIFYFAKYLNMH